MPFCTRFDIFHECGSKDGFVAWVLCFSLMFDCSDVRGDFLTECSVSKSDPPDMEPSGSNVEPKWQQTLPIPKPSPKSRDLGNGSKGQVKPSKVTEPSKPQASVLLRCIEDLMAEPAGWKDCPQGIDYIRRATKAAQGIGIWQSATAWWYAQAT